MSREQTNGRIIFRMNKQLQTVIAVFFLSLAAMQTATAQDYSMVKLKPVNVKNVDLRLESCIREGTTVIITYYLRNNTGKDFYIFNFCKLPQCNNEENLVIVDNLGHNYTGDLDRLHSTWELAGIRRQIFDQDIILANGVWYKGTYILFEVASEVKSFQQINFPFSLEALTCKAYRFGFANLPIYTQADIAEYKRQETMKEVQQLMSKADNGDADAQYQLGNYYKTGNVVMKNLQTALEWYRKSAALGNGLAMKAVGDAYYYGDGVTESNAEALKWYEQAAEKGNDDARALTGAIYYHGGEGITQDKNKAAQYIERASLGGSAKGKYWMGHLYYDGYSGSPDYVQALSFFTEAAKAGDADAQLWAGIMNATGTAVQQNDAKAFEWFQKSAEQGNHSAENWLGLFYLDGKGVGQNINKGRELLEKSAAGGNLHALNDLGGMHYYDKYGVKDLAKAVSYWKQAADKNDATGLGNMGFVYQNGIGVLKNPQTAVEYYEKAAALENVFAKYQLGIINRENNNLTKALTWFEGAAKDGDANAQYETGLMYYYGKGAAKNAKKAAEYMEKAYNSGHKDATKVWNDLQLWKYK